MYPLRISPCGAEEHDAELGAAELAEELGQRERGRELDDGKLLVARAAAEQRRRALGEARGSR